MRKVDIAIKINGVLVTDRIIEPIEKITANKFKMTYFFSLIKNAAIEKVITDAYPIAKALNSRPVGRSVIRFNPSRMLSCATGITFET
jgi:hypothetical protein